MLGHCCVGILNGRPYEYEETGILFRLIATRTVDVDKHHSGHEPIDQVAADAQVLCRRRSTRNLLDGHMYRLRYHPLLVIVIYAQSR